MFVIIGLPIWVLTTSTYRASLPFDSIDQLSKSLNKIEFKVKIEIINFNKDLNAKVLNTAISDLNIRLDKDGKNGVEFEFEIQSRQLTEEEMKNILSHDIEKIDRTLSTKELNKLYVVILDDQNAKKYIFQEQYFFLNCLYIDKNLAKSNSNIEKKKKIFHFF